MVNPQLACKQNRARQIAPGTWPPWADPAHVRDHVHRLLQTATFQAVGTPPGLGRRRCGRSPMAPAQSSKPAPLKRFWRSSPAISGRRGWTRMGPCGGCGRWWRWATPPGASPPRWVPPATSSSP